MEVRFLGGASGVGASCLAVEIAGRTVLVDAGVRMDTSQDRLPDLAALDDIDLAAILVTHAHADHIGALPLVHQHFRHVPIYTTPATWRLMEVMLTDALKVMERRAAEELEIPLYDEALVESALGMLRPLAYGPQALPELPAATLHVRQAGHVAGAVSFGFDAPDGRLVVSGDVSVTPQRTVGGAELPGLDRPDLLVLESTYGARLHANRQAEERRLAAAVAEGVQRGHVLIPAFALGRAQEILLILRAAQRDRLIPEFPIYVDGLVRKVCAAYAGIPEALNPALRRRIQEERRIFFGRNIVAVDSPAQRDRILEGPPCCIVSSSGMLTGGPSAYYAAKLAERAEASILITGYQDEESPGARLLRVAEGTEATLPIGGRSVTLRCRVAKYGLSAHADGAQLEGLVSALRPRNVALVHGDPEARVALAERLKRLATVHLPQDGESLRLDARTRTLPRPPAPPLPAEPLAGAGGDPPGLEGLECLWQTLGDGTGVQRFSLRELARAWYGPGAEPSRAEELETSLQQPQPFFAPIAEVTGFWRLRGAMEVRRLRAGGPQAGSGAGRRVDQAAIQAAIDRHLGEAPDLYRRSVDAATGEVTLRFFFPDVAALQYAPAIVALERDCGTKVTVWPHPHQEMLARTARETLPEGCASAREPSLLLEQRAVLIRCDTPVPAAVLREAEARFLRQTGWRLELAFPGERPRLEAEDLGTRIPSEGRVPYDRTWSVANDLFGPETGCYRIGADQERGVLTLRFHFPDRVEVRWGDLLDELAGRTGWGVVVHPQPHQGELSAAALRCLPEGISAVGSPSLSMGSREATVRLSGNCPDDAQRQAQAAFNELTGWQLLLR